MKIKKTTDYQYDFASTLTKLFPVIIIYNWGIAYDTPDNEMAQLWDIVYHG